MRKLIRTMWHLPRKTLAKFIEFYQHTLSPDHGPLQHLYPYGYCRHEPTCSQYGKQVIEKRGVIVGGLLTLKRILTCVPWRRPSDEKILKTIGKTSQK